MVSVSENTIYEKRQKKKKIRKKVSQFKQRVREFLRVSDRDISSTTTPATRATAAIAELKTSKRVLPRKSHGGK